jgi:alpha-galactosidase
LILPRQNQIWAVLHPQDPLQRIGYSLSATFLGRMCLSGDIAGLPGPSWQLVRQAIALYAKAAPVIKYGISRRFGVLAESWRHPRGWQALVRTSADLALVVVHAFEGAPPQVILPLSGEWVLAESFGGSCVLSDGHLIVAHAGDFSGCVLLFSRPQG